MKTDLFHCIWCSCRSYWTSVYKRVKREVCKFLKLLKCISFSFFFSVEKPSPLRMSSLVLGGAWINSKSLQLLTITQIFPPECNRYSDLLSSEQPLHTTVFKRFCVLSAAFVHFSQKIRASLHYFFHYNYLSCSGSFTGYVRTTSIKKHFVFKNSDQECRRTGMSKKLVWDCFVEVNGELSSPWILRKEKEPCRNRYLIKALLD